MLRNAQKVIEFVEALCKIQLDAVFNPYVDHCPIFDREDAALRRRHNLERSLSAAVELDVGTIWIARDLGYRGGRRTGLALTDEMHLQDFSALLGGVPVERATIGPPAGERTANVIWRMLMRIDEPIFLWNVFPLHPHEPDDPMSNRRHTAKERDACGALFHTLIELLEPERVFAIGNDAHMAVETLGIKSTQVRHPSYGGQNVFIRQIEEAYALPDLVELDLLSYAAPL